MADDGLLNGDVSKDALLHHGHDDVGALPQPL